MQSIIRMSPMLRRGPTKISLWKTALIAILALALTSAVLGPTMPTHRATLHKVSITQLCDQSADSIEASYGVQPPGKPGPSAQTGPATVTVQQAAAPRTLTVQQAAALRTVRQKAVADCRGKLGAQQTVWSYISARAVEIAVDATITVLASTIICYLAPAACKWGVRVAAFLGGFVGSFVFQYLTDGTVDWKTAGYALLDAMVSMLTFSGLDSLSEHYIEQGVTSTLGEAGKAVTSVGNRIGGLGSGFITYMQNAADWINSNVLVAAGWWSPVAGIGYTGGGSVRPATADGHGSVVQAAATTKSATNVEIRAVDDSRHTGYDHTDLHSGSGSNEYYTWTITKLGYTNSDGAIAYAISQGNQCLNAAGSYSKVELATCDYATNSHQVFFMDGDELMAYNGECMDEGADGNRWLADCDGLNYETFAAQGDKDDQFIVTPPIDGTVYPDTITNWQNDLSIYENA
ncbi:hypothetical protein ACFV23_13490 [Streptomyces sp. NPDC059627]|uniref:hypothetical protein n=1 Tax=Streptomyces sp. NPDC001980 TaxID=3157126 RepID=UPI003316BBC3